jgi:hypothetical protein
MELHTLFDVIIGKVFRFISLVLKTGGKDLIFEKNFDWNSPCFPINQKAQRWPN